MREIYKKHPHLLQMPPICIFNILVKNDEEILFIAPDAYKKNSFFLIVNKEDEILNELSFKELYEKIDYYLENGWSASNFFIDIFNDKDIRTWAKDFAEKYKISLE